jgi:hypothetical protein
MQNLVLWKTFWPKKYEVTRDCRKIYNKKIYLLHSLSDKIKENYVSGARSTHWKKKSVQGFAGET